MEIRQNSVSSTVPQAPQDKPQMRQAPLSAGTPEAVSASLPAAKTLISDSELEKAVQKVNDALVEKNSDLAFSIDKDSGKTIIKLVDRETHEILRQYPSEQMLAIAKNLMDFQKSMLISEKV